VQVCASWGQVSKTGRTISIVKDILADVREVVILDRADVDRATFRKYAFDVFLKRRMKKWAVCRNHRDARPRLATAIDLCSEPACVLQGIVARAGRDHKHFARNAKQFGQF